MDAIVLCAVLILTVIMSVSLVRRFTDKIIRDTLKKEGFRTQAVSAELGTEQLLIAKGADGETLVARVKSIPESLAVEVKMVLVPISHDIYYWFEFADGKRVNAVPI